MRFSEQKDDNLSLVTYVCKKGMLIRKSGICASTVIHDSISREEYFRIVLVAFDIRLKP